MVEHFINQSKIVFDSSENLTRTMLIGVGVNVKKFLGGDKGMINKMICFKNLKIQYLFLRVGACPP